MRQSYLYGCLLQGNTGACLESALATQCTFVDNSGFFSGSPKLRNSVCVFNNGNLSAGENYDYNVQDTADGLCLLKNPVFGDYRPVASGAAATAGCADGANGTVAGPTTFEWFGSGTSYWTDEQSPKGYGIDGSPIEIVDGRCVAGAWAEKVDFTPAAEPVCFEGRQTVDGKLFNYRSAVFPEAYPTSYYAKAVPDSGKYLYEYIHWQNGLGYHRFPDMDDGIRVMPMAPGGQVTTNSYRTAEKVLWLDPESGNDSNAGTSAAAPIRTLQKIYDNRYGRTLALCAPGTYGEIGASANPSVQWGCSNVANFVGARIRLKSLEGPEKTFIRGRLDESTLGAATLPGAGYAAMRAFCVQYPGQIQGFTIYDAASGRTTVKSPDNDSLGGANAEYGGVVFGSIASDTGYSGSFSVADCVISNCAALYGPAGSGIVLERCFVTNCSAYSQIVRGGVSRSVFVDNHFSPSSAARSISYSRIADSTVVDVDGLLRPGSAGEASQNTVYLGGDAPHISSGSFAGCICWNFTTRRNRDGLVWADPFVISPTCHIGACSPAAVSYDVAHLDDCIRLVSDDMDGAAPSFSTAGAFNTTVPGFGIQAENGGIAVDGATVGFTPADGFTSATITRGEGPRPCIGYTVGGATNLFDDVETRTFSLSDIAAAGGGIRIEAIYTKDWYVNANVDPVKGVVGDDANTGFTPKTAKRTLKGAMNAAGLASGDTVHAAAGDYNSETMLQTTPRWEGVVPTLPSRVVVKFGVSLVGDEGREKTFITGAGDFVTDPDYGLGPNAIRCAMLEENASISGFTLRGGRTDSTANNYNDNSTGAGVLGYNADKTKVSDCTVTNCAAYRGGAFRQLTAERCKVFDCLATCDSASVGGDVSLYNVFCDYNKGIYLVTIYNEVVNCTFGSHNTRRTSDTTAWAVTVPSTSSARVRNVLSLIPTASNGVHLRSYFTGNVNGSGDLQDGSAVTNAASLAIDGNGRPVIGSNVGIDAANEEYLAGENALLDADGGQRVYNGRLDIGCYDADWRETYANDIAASPRLSVDNASPGVYESDGGKVRIPAGGLIAATWNGNAGDKYLLTVTLPGDGVLTVTSNGSAIATLTGPADGKVLSLESASAAFPLELSYAGDDSHAEIVGMRRNVGWFMIVQ